MSEAKSAHETILAEWRDSLSAVLAGSDPLEEPDSMAAYLARFAHLPKLRVGAACDEPGCDQASHTSGKCRYHYDMQCKNLCAEVGCSRYAFQTGRCRDHYVEARQAAL